MDFAFEECDALGIVGEMVIFVRLLQLQFLYYSTLHITFRQLAEYILHVQYNMSKVRRKRKMEQQCKAIFSPDNSFELYRFFTLITDNIIMRLCKTLSNCLLASF